MRRFKAGPAGARLIFVVEPPDIGTKQRLQALALLALICAMTSALRAED